jgi:type IV pilus assembly protein PilM
VDEKSIWKKEISFGRKRKDAPPEADDETREEPAADAPTSIWKKEISFGRKKKSEPVADEPSSVEAEPTAEEEPVWQKAVTFGRKHEAEREAAEEERAPLEAVADEPEPEADPEPEEQVWTRAVTFGRAQEPEPVVEERAPLEAVPDEPEPVAAVPDDPGSDPEPGPEEPTPEVEAEPEEQVWTKAVSFGRKEDAEPPAEERARLEAVADEPEPEATQSEPAPGVEPQPEEEQVWTRAVSFGRKQEPEPTEDEPATDEPATDESAPLEAVADEPEPVAAVSEDPGSDPEPGPELPTPPPVTAASEAPTDTWSAQPVLPPEPELGPEAPFAAAVPEAKVPFWKKDISFGGSRKAPKAEKPKAERAPKEPKTKAPKERRQKEPKVKAPRGAKGAKRLVGLKIGASQLAAARVSNNGSAELLQVARRPLEPGIVVGGELRDPDALAEALKEFFATNKLPKKGVRLGIANNRIGVRTFDVAGINDQKQLANAVRFRAQEALPIPIDEAVLDYQVLGEGVGADGQPTKRILLVVAYRELIDRYVDACKKAGIALVGIDLEAFALLRVLQAPQEGVGSDPSAALVAVAIGHERSTFAVSDGRVCEFTRVLEWGGAALNVAIARAVDAAPSEVESAKRALALTDEMVPEGLTAEQAKKAREAMRRAIQTFARELVSSLQYYQNQPGSLGIGEIVLTGGTAHLPGLALELERLIGVRVRVGDPLARMKVSKKVGETEQIGSLAVAIGLGIED